MDDTNGPEDAGPIKTNGSAAGIDSIPSLFSSFFRHLFKWGALIVTLGGLALHAAGFIHHHEYLKAWGIDADLFPKPVDWVLISGYYVITFDLAALALFIMSKWWVVVLVVIFMSTFVWAIVMLAPQPERLRADLFRTVSKRAPRWLMILCVSHGYTAIVLFSAACAPFIAAAVLFWPAITASKHAQSQAKAYQAHYQTGCERARPQASCITVQRPGAEAVRGFLIASSDKLLAIYLPAENQVRIVQADGAELTAEPPLQSITPEQALR